MAKIVGTQEKETVIDEMASTIAAWSLSTARTLFADMYEVMMEEGITSEQNYRVHLEILTFFLLDFERYAVGRGGEEFLDMVLNETVNEAIALVLDELRLDSEESQEEKLDHALDYYNSAAADYDSCQVLVEKKRDYDGSKTVLGRLGFRIAKALGKLPVPEITDMVAVVAAEALAESELKQKVSEVYSQVSQ